jgi:hypothetical protein
MTYLNVDSVEYTYIYRHSLQKSKLPVLVFCPHHVRSGGVDNTSGVHSPLL